MNEFGPTEVKKERSMHSNNPNGNFNSSNQRSPYPVSNMPSNMGSQHNYTNEYPQMDYQSGHQQGGQPNSTNGGHPSPNGQFQQSSQGPPNSGPMPPMQMSQDNVRRQQFDE